MHPNSVVVRCLFDAGLLRGAESILRLHNLSWLRMYRQEAELAELVDESRAHCLDKNSSGTGRLERALGLVHGPLGSPQVRG